MDNQGMNTPCPAFKSDSAFHVPQGRRLRPQALTETVRCKSLCLPLVQAG